MKMKQNEPLPDPVIDEIREVRHRISARFDHDPSRLVAYYLELQKRYQDRLIQTEQQVGQSKSA
jgi:ribosome maturation factor RimP